MATIKMFEDLEVWQKARTFCSALHKVITRGTFERDFGLRDQINRSSGSVMDNIAEGFERDGKHEFIQFLSYSKASAGEVRSQLYRALDRGHISKIEFDEMTRRIEEISRMLNGLINYLRKSQMQGTKYKASEPESTDWRRQLET